MKNYAGHRLSPWLGHLMVSRSETARPLLTPGEVMQLPPSDEIVMVAGTPPIRASKARYYADPRFQERILPPAELAKPKSMTQDDWSARPLPPTLLMETRQSGASSEDDDPTGSERRRQPELARSAATERQEPIDDEFVDLHDEMEDDAARAARLRRAMQRVARQVSLDPADGMDL